MGDAAHVPTPMTGSGFSASLHDAEAVAEAVCCGRAWIDGGTGPRRVRNEAARQRPWHGPVGTAVQPLLHRSSRLSSSRARTYRPARPARFLCIQVSDRPATSGPQGVVYGPALCPSDWPLIGRVRDLTEGRRRRQRRHGRQPPPDRHQRRRQDEASAPWPTAHVPRAVPEWGRPA
ncbi:hypothetical protein [Streptomyces sp. NPDC012466]|uniref:hypothetical protein n=1 Tax=Streptomyces sp. NPDC012466 TaxID=3364835 RepID=UPI0036ED5A5C